MSLRRAAPIVLAILLPACAEAPPPAMTPAPYAAPATPEGPRTFEPGAKGPAGPVDGEMLTIAKLEEEIDRLFPAASRPSPHKKGAEEKPADKPPAKDDFNRGEGRLSTADTGTCATACRALASMLTAAEHLCKLAGESDGRCEDARGRVRGASARVKSACPACSASAK
ncbi:Hypothetical protein A7982_09875 [Minicystis rosea]|nr:Hypothetical protein A7982_09875 [Minicystis rosea]